VKRYWRGGAVLDHKPSALMVKLVERGVPDEGLTVSPGGEMGRGG
jgi:hypothetical protein